QHTEDRLLGPTSCKTCTKVIAKGNPRKCDKCGWHYHPRCTPTQPIYDNGKTIQVCRNCLLVYNLFLSGTLKSSASPQGGNSSASTTRPSSPQPADTAILNKILEKLNKLDSIEKIQNTTKNEAEENGRLLGKRMSVIEISLEPLDEIPRLMNRMTVVEADVAVLELSRLTSKESMSRTGPSTDSSSASALDLETVRQLRDSNARIQAQLDRVASSQAKLSAELVITGLASTWAISLRLLAYIALKPLDAQLTERDITSARPLIKR
ncbi:hypothetical protein TSAR_012221, partial [Trichomalopsis sarcophagae]